MPNVPASEVKPTDTVLFIPLSTAVAASAVVGDSARRFHLFQAQKPIRVVQMEIHTSGTSTAGNTLRAGFGSYDPAATPAIFNTTTNVLGVASGLPTANTFNSVPIESTSSTDNTPLTVVPAGAYVGFNIPAVGTNAMTLVAARVVYRDA